MTLGFGCDAGLGLTSRSSVSSARAGAPETSANAQPALVHVSRFVKIFMIISSNLQ